MNILINKVYLLEDIQKCLKIRKEVFVEGQKVPIDEDVDGKDGICDHYLVLADDKPVGVARVRFVDNYIKIERVAILDSYQGNGLAKMLLNKIIFDIKTNTSCKMIKLSSQTYVIPFYEKLGFIVCCDDEYIDAGIPHKNMQLNLE